MHGTMKRYSLSFIVALLAVFLFVSTVSADDGSDGGSVSGEPAVTSTSNTDSGSENVIARDSENTNVDGDPWYRVGTEVYHFYSTGDAVDCSSDPTHCKKADNPIQAALDTMKNNAVTPSDHNLYVENGAYTGDVSVDGTANGVKGLTGLIGAGSDQSTINGNVSVSNESAGFTLAGLSINGGVAFTTNSGPVTLKDLDVKNTNGDGIQIDNQNGAIVLMNVESSNNSTYGASLANDSSSTAFPITILNSEFDDNGSVGSQENVGLLISTTGATTIDGISVSRNYGTGLILIKFGPSTPTAVRNGIFSNNSSTNTDNFGNGAVILTYGTGALTLSNITAESNANNGIQLFANGTLTASNIVASENQGTGMDVNHGNYGAGLIPGAVSIFNGDFENNSGDYGLVVYSARNILLSNVEAVNNYNGYGAFLNNCLDNGTGICTGNGSVTILDPNSVALDFSDSGTTGLDISASGAVTITGVRASYNGGSGISVVNNYIGKIGVVIIKNVASTDIRDHTYFQSNGGNGISVLSNGAVTINGMTTNYTSVSSSGNYGIYVDNTGSSSSATVNISYINISYSDTDADDNASDNLHVVSDGTITLNQVTAYGRGSGLPTEGNGISLDNSSGNGSIKINSATGNSNKKYGFLLLTNGSVTLSDVTANSNGMSGASIDNCGYDALSKTCKGSAAVSILGSDNEFSSNGDDGLYILTLGAVTINNISAGNNIGSGVYVTVPDTISHVSGAVKVINSSSNIYYYYADGVYYSNNSNQYSNGQYGLYIKSFGAVTVQEFTNYQMGNTGIYITNEDAVSAQPVTIKNVEITNAGNNGIEIYSRGAVTVIGSTANYSQNGDGILIDNHDGTANVTFQSTKTTYSGGYVSYEYNFAEGNSGNGITILTNGIISLTGLDADSNGGNGIDVNNTLSGLVKPVILASVYSKKSGGDGILIQTLGSITMTDVGFLGNGGTGADLSNNGANPAPVTIKNGQFSYNTIGLQVLSKGNFILNGVTASDNFYRDYSLGSLDGFDGGGLTVSSYIGEESASYCYTNDCSTTSASAAWSFSITGTSISLKISAGFAGTLYLYDGNGNIIDQTSFDADIVETLSSSELAAGMYRAVILPDEWDYGIYDLSINDDDYSNQINFDAGGIELNNKDGNGNVTFGPGSYTSVTRNGGYGVRILTTGTVTITNITSQYNQKNNLSIDNTYSPIAKPVSITNGYFSGSKASTGLLVHSNGNITVTNISSSNNSVSGAYLDNSSIAIGSTTPGTITINASNWSSFDGNGGDGLAAASFGAIKFNVSRYFEASDNGDNGVALQNNIGSSNAGISVMGIFYKPYNQASIYLQNNGVNGITIQSSGPVVMNYVYAYYNGSSNIAIGDLVGETGPSSVSVSNITSYNAGVKFFSGDGIAIYASGPVTITSAICESNRYGNGINVMANGAVTVKKVKVTYDAQTGLSVVTSGAVILDSIQAVNNGQGTYIDADGPVTLLGSSYVNNFDNNNDGAGLTIYSHNNAVTLNKFTASNNDQSGVSIECSGKLTVNNGVTNNNGSNGIEGVVGNGAAINALTSFNNGIDGNFAGLRLDISTGNVAIANSSFVGNTGNGIWVKPTDLPIVTVTLSNTSYFGNDTNNSGDRNYHYGTL